MATTAETEIGSYPTSSGSAVLVLQLTAVRVKSLSEMAEVEGPTWRCTGCGEGSDRPLTTTALGDPVRVVSGAALAHSQSCRK